MSFVRKILVLAIGLVLFGSTAALAQIERPGQKFNGRAGMTGIGKEATLLVPPDSRGSVPSGYKDYQDDGLNDLNQKMKEREWGSEDTAWRQASDSDSSQAYERYLAIYPNGAHAAEATVRLVSAKVNETLANAHNELPEIKQTSSDEFSPTSTVMVQNNTGYPLTVYCSGTDNRTVVIPPDKKAAITIKNGQYKLAATVPPSHIRPYAGQTSFSGGEYEIGFWVVTI